jgi:hypothetical protein
VAPQPPPPSKKKTKLKHNLKNVEFVDIAIPNFYKIYPSKNKVKNSGNLRKNLKKQD